MKATSCILSLLSLGILVPYSLAAPFVPVRDPQCVAFAPSGAMVATACSGLSDGGFPPRPHPEVRKCGVVAIWDVGTGKRLRRMETFGDITKLAFSPDGSLLAACRLFAMPDGVTLHEVRIWDAVTGNVVKTLDRCEAFDFAPEGKSLAVLSRTKCVVYDLADWRKETLVKPLGSAIAIEFSADSKALCGICPEAAASEPKFRIRVCDLASSEITRESLTFDKPFYTLAASPDGKWLASGHEAGNVVLWDYETLDVRTRFQTGENGLAYPIFSPDSKRLAGGCQENADVVIWTLADRQEIGRFTFEKGSFRTYYPRGTADILRPEKDPSRFAFSPDGESIFVGCYGGILRAVVGGQELRRFGD